MLTLAAAAPRSAAAWTSDGTSHEQRGLKHRPDGAVRPVPIPPIPARMLRIHTDGRRTAPDGRLFPGTRGEPAQRVGVRPRLAHRPPPGPGPRLAATALARRPCDQRHAALSLWLNAGAPPAQIAARAGHSVTVLLTVYAHCVDGQDQITNRLIERAAPPRRAPSTVPESERFREPPPPLPDPVRYMSVRPARTPRHGPHPPGPAD